MRILITGATGLIGSHLIPRLKLEGHETVRLVRSTLHQNKDDIYWNPLHGKIEATRLNGFDAVIHLAGENIFGRWTKGKQLKIQNSRIQGTKLLCQTLSTIESPPKVFIGASGVGFYGDRGDEVLTEDSHPGDGFFPDLCQAWEGAAKPVIELGVRTVHLRTSMVLTATGGGLATMLPAFRMGIGGVVGDGKQYMSWVSMDDTLEIILFALTDTDLSGPINVVSPQPVTNFEFTKTLGSVLKRPTVLPVPGFALRLIFGDLADEVLLSSARVLPDRLKAHGYDFMHSELNQALRYVLNRT